MKVTVASSAGFCFGVERAVNLVYKEASERQGHVYTMGPIIHNELVVADLEKKGVEVIDDNLICEKTGNEVKKEDTVIVRSHGISKALYEKLKERHCKIVNATCPFVQKIHNIVREHSEAGEQIVIVGSASHPEVQGIRGWASGPCAVVESSRDVDQLSLDHSKKVCVVSQTTFNLSKFREIVEKITLLGYHVVVKNTICNATRERQAEALDLAGRSDVMIVIGGKASSNTQKLYEICKSQCKNTYYIQTQEDLVTADFQSDSCVGITAGASTPNNIIQEVSQHVRGTKF